MIAKITKAYIRLYSDSGQCKAYVEWIDHKGQSGRTEGDSDKAWGPTPTTSEHMWELFRRARREGIEIAWERW